MVQDKIQNYYTRDYGRFLPYSNFNLHEILPT